MVLGFTYGVLNILYNDIKAGRISAEREVPGTRFDILPVLSRVKRCESKMT